MWQISDINYAMQSDAAKQNILTQLGTVYAGIPADCWMQVCIVSQRMDEKAFARDVLYHRENDGFDALRAERNRQIKANARENGNVVQHKYIIVSTNKPGVKEARERFVQVQGHLLSAFSALECSVTPLDNRARLEVLHKFFRISEEGRFNFDFNMLFAKADAVRGDRIAEVLPQFGAIIKVEVKTTLLGNAEKLVQYLQPCAVVQRRDGTFQGGKCRQQMPLHLYKAFAGQIGRAHV